MQLLHEILVRKDEHALPAMLGKRLPQELLGACLNHFESLSARRVERVMHVTDRYVLDLGQALDDLGACQPFHLAEVALDHQVVDEQLRRLDTRNDFGGFDGAGEAGRIGYIEYRTRKRTACFGCLCAALVDEWSVGMTARAFAAVQLGQAMPNGRN
jgi:hypothetical protein